MKIERVDDNKIRVIVSFDDLEERDIDVSTFSYSSPETQELFWDLMEQAETELGFNVAEEQLCIEAVSDVDEGFIITITKMDEDGEFESIHKFIKNKYKKNDLSVKAKTSSIRSTQLMYRFENFDDLSLCAKKLFEVYKGLSTAYSCENKHYMLLSNSEGNISSVTNFIALMDEYAQRVEHPIFFEGYLNEHGRVLIKDNAIQVLAYYF